MSTPSFITPKWPAPKNIKAICTTRGHSKTGFGFNLALHIGDDPKQVHKNRHALKEHFKLIHEPTWLEQTHSNTVIKASHGIQADASFTSEKNRACVVLTADCLPILICNQTGTEVAAIHAGWRGLANGVIKNTIIAMKTPPHELLAWLGPAIGPEKFQIGPEVREQFLQLDLNNTSAFKADKQGKYLADIFMLASLQLQTLGLNNVTSSDLCTVTNTEDFFSYRRDGIHSGRMASLIWINGH